MRNPRRNNAIRLAAVVAFYASVPASFSQTSIRFTDITEKSGVRFTHTDGSSGQHYIVEYVSAGMATFDFDNDGDIDIYFLNGSPQPGANKKQTPRNALYRNDGNWKFTDVSRQANVDHAGHGLGVTVGDYDNDGDADIYLNNMGPNTLYRNNGDGTFTDVTDAAGVKNGDRVGAGTCFVDIDNDGDLDLYAANYIKYSYDKHIPRTQQGFPVYGSPRDYPPDPDTLFRNNGDGTFTDVSKKSGIANQAAYGMGMVCADYDSDGDSDIFVGNDVGANFLFENDGRGKFKEVALIKGFAYDGRGTIQGTMGLDCADFDNDGHLDFHVTSYQHELATLYKNLSGTFLQDVTNLSGVGRGTFAQVTWGNGFADFDNDGDRDIFIACGHLYDNVDQFDDRTSYNAKNLVLQNEGNGRFSQPVGKLGSGMAVKLSSRGACFDDLDNDGDLDVIVLNSRQQPTLLRNDSRNTNNWVQLILQGSYSNRDAVGSRVEITSGAQKQIAEVHSGRGYQGHFGSRLHFGLGKDDRIDEIRIKWPSGKVDVLQDQPAKQIISIQERRVGD